MKRDMDLIREILLKTEELPETSNHPLVVDGRSPAEVYEHAKLAKEAGLIEAQLVQSFNTLGVLCPRLTWAGHDFLESARQDTFWHRWKDRVITLGVPLTIEGMKAVLPEVVKIVARGGK